MAETHTRQFVTQEATIVHLCKVPLAIRMPRLVQLMIQNIMNIPYS
jgi:hypothetical protein